MIITPTMMMQIMPYIAAAAEKITGKKTGLPEMLQILPEITKAFGSPKIGTPTDPSPIPDSPNPTPGTDTGLTIGGGLSGKYNSPILGVLPFGKDESPFDLNYDTQQLDRLGLYNNTKDSLFDWLGR